MSWPRHHPPGRPVAAGYPTVLDQDAASRRFVVSRGALLEIGLAVLAALAYFGIRNLTAGSADVALANAQRLVRVERALHLAWEVRLQALLAGHETLVTAANWVYIWGHWPVIVVSSILLYRYRRDRFWLLRNAIFVSAAIGFLFFVLFPVAPPRLAGLPLIDTVTEQSHTYRVLQPPGFTNQFAAFPSLHFGWNLLVGVAVWGASTRVVVRSLAVIGPAAMAIAVVMTANHYIIDVFGGLAVVLAALAVALWLQRSTNRPPPQLHGDG